MPPAAIAPLVILVVAYLVWILRDIAQSEVEHLPKWAWVLLTILSIPLGGIIYLLMGRAPK